MPEKPYTKGGITFQRQDDGTLKRINKPTNSVSLTKEAQQVLNRPKVNKSSSSSSSSNQLPTKQPNAAVEESQATPAAVPSVSLDDAGIDVTTPAQRLLATGQNIVDFVETPTVGPDVQTGTPPLLGTPGGILKALRIGRAAASAASATKTTAVAEELTVGAASKVEAATSTAETIATNSASAGKTASWFSRLARSATNPQAVVGGLMAVIGSYPFAGFIKEEALQTSGFAVKTALENDDFDGAQAALDLQREMLDPNLWDQIKAGVPFVNVVDKLNDFYKAARLKMEVDARIVEDLRIQNETGESDADFWDRVNSNREEESSSSDESDDAYWAEINRQKAVAAQEERDADLAYWNDVLSRQEESLRRKKQIELDYWAEYYKTIQKFRDDSTYSKLSFGLL